jgi:hypothetical protein
MPVIHDFDSSNGPKSASDGGSRQISVEAVHANPAIYYGDFADPDVGGANVLFAAGIETARARKLGEDQVLVGGPEDFGFDVDKSSESVVSWRKKRIIAVEAVGFGLGDWQTALAQWEGFRGPALNKRDVEQSIADWQSSGLQFGLAVLLHGLEDPPVVIPMGAIYQQPSLGSTNQNLAVAKSNTSLVGAGATVPLVLPAWCLNPTFSPPNGPMFPTPLVASSASGSQQGVWSSIRTRYQGQRS